MTNCTLHSGSGVEYASTTEYASETVPGVRYSIRRVSFARRVELVKKVRGLAARAEYLEAGTVATEKIDAALLHAEIDQAYLECGLAGVEGLEIDGVEADRERLVERGPERLCREIIGAVKREFGLSEEERKN